MPGRQLQRGVAGARLWRACRWRVGPAGRVSMAALLAVMMVAALGGCALSLTAPTPLASTPAHGVTVPAQIRRGVQGAILVVVDVSLQGKGPYPMALDTGASLTLLDSTLTQRLGLKQAGAPEQISGVGGSQTVTPVKITQWSVGAAQLSPMTITSAPLSDLQRSAGIVGLLGSDALSRYGAVTVDYVSSQVTLYPIAKRAAAAWRRSPGLAASERASERRTRNWPM